MTLDSDTKDAIEWLLEQGVPVARVAQLVDDQSGNRYRPDDLVGGGTSTGGAVDAVADDSTTIADAIASLPDPEGGTVRVDPSYAAGDTLPILVDRKVRLVGHGMTRSVIDHSGNTTDPVFEVDHPNNRQYGFEMSNVGVFGGERTLNISTATRSLIQNCWFDGPANHFVGHNEDGTSQAVWFRMDDCLMRSAGGVGIEFAGGAWDEYPNQAVFNNCIVQDCASWGARLVGNFVSYINGDVSQSDGGIRVLGPSSNATVRIEGNWFEGNGGGGNDVDVEVADGTDTRPAVVWGNYHNSAGTAPSNAVVFFDTGTGVYGNSMGQNRGVRFDNYCTDCFAWVDPVDSVSAASGATRPRVNGVIYGGPLGGADLSTITGAQAGDLALASGASAAPADVIAAYDGSAWVYPSRGGTVTA